MDGQTADCPTCFKTQYQLPHSPKFNDAKFSPPVCTMDLWFDVSMNQAKVPSAASFVIYKDGVPETPGVPSWVSATQLTMNFSAGAPTDVHIELASEDSNLESLAGVTCQSPQRIKAHT